MKILVLNGSPRKKGNTAALVAAFKEGAESKGNEVEVIPVGNLKIAGCIGCEYCHTKGEGKCVQQDDMQSVYPKLASSDMVVFASPVYYFAFTGQMQNVITRFYAPWSPAAKKYALILSSGSPDVYDAIKTQYLGFLRFIKAQDCGIKTFCGTDQTNEKNLAAMREFGASL